MYSDDDLGAVLIWAVWCCLIIIFIIIIAVLGAVAAKKQREMNREIPKFALSNFSIRNQTQTPANVTVSYELKISNNRSKPLNFDQINLRFYNLQWGINWLDFFPGFYQPGYNISLKNGSLNVLKKDGLSDPRMVLSVNLTTSYRKINSPTNDTSHTNDSSDPVQIDEITHFELSLWLTNSGNGSQAVPFVNSGSCARARRVIYSSVLVGLAVMI